jgi:hypothetical protein
MATESGAPTSESKLGSGISASLVVSNESQDLAETRHGQQTTVLRIGNLPYLSQYCRRKLGSFKELDSDLACYDAELLCVGLLEEILEDALLFGCEIEDGLVYACLARPRTVRHDAAYSILRLLRGPPWLCNSRRWSL